MRFSILELHYFQTLRVVKYRPGHVKNFASRMTPCHGVQTSHQVGGDGVEVILLTGGRGRSVGIREDGLGEKREGGPPGVQGQRQDGVTLSSRATKTRRRSVGVRGHSHCCILCRRMSYVPTVQSASSAPL